VSFEPYQCLHVPVKAAQARVFGVPLWLAWLAVAAAAVKVYGPWLVLAPALVLLVTAAAVIVLAAVRTRATGPAAGTATGGRAAVDVLTGAPVVALSGLGPLPCMGCGTGAAMSVLEVGGYRIPVCDTCQATAQTRITAMAAAGMWRALE
jgi:hypothetical protein